MSSAIKMDGDKALAVFEGVDIQSLITKAIEKESPIEVMERLVAMRRELKAEQAKERYFAELALFQAECPTIKKNEVVYDRKDPSKVRYRYAPLSDIIAATRDLLKRHGFSYVITTKQEPSTVTAICEAHHEDGHAEATEFSIPIDPESYMNAAQKVASALTYAKRYAFCNAFGIMTADEDDDAHGTDPHKSAGGDHRPVFTKPEQATDVADDKPACPKCKKAEGVIESKYPGNGKFYCRPCKLAFDDDAADAPQAPPAEKPKTRWDCPDCGAANSVIKSKFAPHGFYCFECKTKFTPDHPAFTGPNGALPVGDEKVPF